MSYPGIPRIPNPVLFGIFPKSGSLLYGDLILLAPESSFAVKSVWLRHPGYPTTYVPTGKSLFLLAITLWD